MKTCYVMVGVPGCGKTTATKNLLKLVNPTGDLEVRTFSQDAAYFDFAVSKHTGQFWSDNETDRDIYSYCFKFMTQNQKEFEAFVEARWKWALESSAILINDRTNVIKKERAKYLQEARAKGFQMIAVYVHVPLNIALSRQLHRPDKAVPEQVIRDKYMRWNEFLVGSEVDYILHIDGTASEFKLHGSLTCT